MKDDFSQDEKTPSNSNQTGNSSSVDDDDSLEGDAMDHRNRKVSFLSFYSTNWKEI